MRILRSVVGARPPSVGGPAGQAELQVVVVGITSRTSARASASRGPRRRAALVECDRLGQVAAPGAPASAQDSASTRARSALDGGAAGVAPVAQRRDGARQLAFGLGSDGKPRVAGAKRTGHGAHGIMRLITKSGAADGHDRLTDAAARQPRGRHRPHAALLPRPGDRGARAAADLRAHLAARGARVAAPEARAATSPPRPAPSRCWCCATRTASCAPSATSAATAARACSSGAGECGKAIRCRYHGWTYRLDGNLIGVPEGRAIAGDLDKSTLGLFPARVETLCGLVFVNLDLARRAARRARSATCRSGSSATGSSARAVRPPADGEPAGQLEDRRRQLPRGLPHADRPSRADAAARLQALRASRCTTNYVWFEAPLRDKPRGNLARARLPAARARRCRGSTEEDRRVWRYVFIYPNTTIDLYPDQVGTWKIDPDGRARAPATTAMLLPAPRAPACAPGSRSASTQAEHAGGRRGRRPGRQRPGGARRRRGWSCGPLSGREAAVAWFADRIRADLGADCERRASRPSGRCPRPDRERPRAHPRRRRRADRERRHRRGPDRAHRDGRGRVDLARALPLRDARGAARPGARVLLRAGRRRAHRRRRGRRAGSHARAAGGDDRPVPAVPGPARARLDPVGRAVAARGAPPRAAADRRAPLRADARRGSPTAIAAGVERGRVRAAATPRRWPTACSRCSTASACAR